jgi:hypothetical protein
MKGLTAKEEEIMAFSGKRPLVRERNVGFL